MTLDATQFAELKAQLKEELLGEMAKGNDYGEPLDNLWMLLGGILVFFMHTGFSMLETGNVRFKNAQSILCKNLMVVCIGFLCWYLLGYGLAFGTTAGKFIGTDTFVGKGFAGTYKMREWFFQGAFCATAATIVSGSMAERTKLEGFAFFIVLLTAFLYPVVVHWGWSGQGILNDGEGSIVGPGYNDFAGSGIVHMVGGVAAAVGAAIVGPRHGRWTNPEGFAPHNPALCVLGTLVLWFGWYGFNGASTLSMKTSDDAFSSALVCMNTTLAPAVAGLVVFLLRRYCFEPRCFDVMAICNGILGGLVSITAPCGSVEPGESVAIGFIGAFVYQGASMLMVKLKIDDPLDAFAVHGACGFWGVLAAGLFGEGNGAFYGGDQLGVQIVAALLIAVWIMVPSTLLLFALKRGGMLRVPHDVEKDGLDMHEHTPTGLHSASPVSAKV